MSWYRNIFVDDEPEKEKPEPWFVFRRAMARLLGRREETRSRIADEDATLRRHTKVYSEQEWHRWYRGRFPNDRPVGFIPGPAKKDAKRGK